jgi:hypothetical protein
MLIATSNGESYLWGLHDTISVDFIMGLVSMSRSDGGRISFNPFPAFAQLLGDPPAINSFPIVYFVRK